MPPLTPPRRAATPFRSLVPREISFLRSSMDALDSGRPRCADCHRTPLVGEMVHVYPASAGDRVVCELCRARHREPPARSELVHSPEHDRAVKVRSKAA
jgi:hypothetical protein